jgi:5-methylcytosine-specific restriction endonuclease McrA
VHVLRQQGSRRKAEEGRDSENARFLCLEHIEKKRAARNSTNRLRRRAMKKGSCEDCGFVAKHPCQLDLDHADGDRENDSPENLRTLCANCHRLKTLRGKESLWWQRSRAAADVEGVNEH